MGLQNLNVYLLRGAGWSVYRLSCISSNLIYDSTKGMQGDWELISSNLVSRLVAEGANMAL